MAGAIGCIAGQLMILAYVGVTRYGGDIIKLGAAVGVPRVSAPLMRVDDATALSASVRPEPAASRDAASPPDAVSPPPVADAVPVQRDAAERAPAGATNPVPADATSPAPAAAINPAPRAVTSPAPRAATNPAPAAPIPAPMAATAPAPASVRDLRNDPAPPQRQEAARETPRSPLPLRGPVVGPGDWVESQAELRSALREWLAISEFRGVALVSEAEVILGADGSTAKTRVPTKSGHRMVTREQRWERSANGWNIVADREVERTRP